MGTLVQPADPAVLVDLPFISTTYSFPESQLQSLLVAPTVELVGSLFIALVRNGHDINSLRAEKLKLDVELENVVRTCDAKVKAQKATVARHVKEVEEIRVQLNDAERAREALSTDLTQLRSDTSSSTTETALLRQRITTLEASNRDALALVESKSAQKDRVAAELSEQHGKILTLRREVAQLEEKCQSLENAASSQRFKEQSMQQELELIKRNNEWNSNELQTRNQEHAKFRKERNARISSLQRELEDAITTVESLKRSEGALRKRLDEMQVRAEEAIAKAATMREDASRKEQDMRLQIDSNKRLAELQAQNAATHKTRLQEVERQVSEVRDSAAEEIGRLQAEIETERSDKEQAEARVAELELTIEQLENAAPRYSRPSTPRRNGHTDPSTPIRLPITDSPSVIPGTLRKVVGGLSFTQLYANYSELQQELEDERRRTQKLSTAMDELMTEMETRTPEIVELKADSERLEAEVLSFSQLLDETKALRDQAVKDAERFRGQAESTAQETEILRQQLRDLSAQIKILLVEIQSRDQGLGEMSAQERFELERAARGEADADALEHMTSTGRLISERLVIFHNVNDLQSKNEDLLRITRQLGEAMEGEEAQEKARQSAEYASENEALKQTISRYRDELNATATQISSYMKERDMFRRMLQHRGQIMPDADLQITFGQSMGPPATPQRVGAMPPQTPRSKDLDDLNKILKEQQIFFDQYRTESTADRRIIKDQVDALMREKASLQADVARLQSQLTLSGERYEMLQSNFSAARSENSELQRRTQQLSENGARQDLRIQQVAEELVEAKSFADSLRNENANAKAEKELWKRIEQRLTEDNKNLLDERSRLNKIVTDLQHLQNEREMTESEVRRRLQTRVEQLESELVDNKRKLESEADETKKLILRREFEESQSRTRIDDLVTSLSSLREELAAIKASRDQLHGRVDELKIELRAAEDKASALQPRPTQRSATAVAPGSNGVDTGDASGLTTEQRLAVEIADARRDLDLAKADLEATRGQVEQYKAIAQASEEELASFSETSDQYRTEMDQLLASKSEQLSRLEQRIEDLNTELAASNAELSELRTRADDNTRALNEQSSIFNSEIARFKDDAERYLEEKKLYQADLKAQAEIAQQAQLSYEEELLKHADAAKALQTIRKDYNDLREDVAGVKAEAEASKARLEASEESWLEQRDQLESEMQVLKQRREDAAQQNKLLHQQLETFSAELSALRANRAGSLPGAADGDDSNSSQPASTNNLQEVIKFLRREKEIVDVQYELALQDGRRLQQQLDYANSQLEDTRQKLAEEKRQATEKSSAENSTTKLMQTINELNLFRESAVTLRNEARIAREKLESNLKDVDRLTAEIEPLKSRVGELEGELEGKLEEIRLLNSDRDHWRERTQNIISKYDRVDPAELEELKRQLDELKTDKARLEQERIPLNEQIQGIEARVAEARDTVTTSLNDRLARFKEQAKEQNRKQNDKIRILGEELEQIRGERDRTSVDLSAAQSELESMKRELDDARGKLTSIDELRTMLDHANAELQEQRANAAQNDAEEEEEGQVNEDVTDVAQQPEPIKKSAEDPTDRLAQQEQLIQSLNVRNTELDVQVASLQAELSQLQQTRMPDDSTPGNANLELETLENLKHELSQAQQEVETLRAKATSGTADAVKVAGDTDEDASKIAEIAELKREMEAQHALAIAQMEEERDKKIERMKANLSRQLREEREKLRNSITEELAAQHSSELQALRDEHDVAVKRLRADHQAEIERLSRTTGQASSSTPEPRVKTEGSDISEAQMLDLVKTNPRMKQIVQNNIRKHVAVEAERLGKIIAEKDAQLAQVKSGGDGAATFDDKDDLVRQIKVAQAEKEAAVKDAVTSIEMRTRVQLSQRDRLQAQVAVVQKAVKETPEESVAKVWEVASKAKPAPKPAATSSTAGNAVAPSNAPQVAGQAGTAAKESGVGGQVTSETNAPAAAKQTSFGKPSAAAANLPAPVAATPTTFGLPSKPPASIVNSSTNSPNPNAAAFVPGGNPASANRGTNVSRAGGSSLPRGNFGGGNRGNAGQSSLPRGGGGGGRGGRGGGAHQGANRGGAAAAGNNAGQKRTNDGSGGGDDKRQRGGGPSA